MIINFLQLSPCTRKACNLYKYVLELSLNMLAIHRYIIYTPKKEYNFHQGSKLQLTLFSKRQKSLLETLHCSPSISHCKDVLVINVFVSLKCGQGIKHCNYFSFIPMFEPIITSSSSMSSSFTSPELFIHTLWHSLYAIVHFIP